MKKIISLVLALFLFVGCGSNLEYDPKNLMSDSEIKSMFSNTSEYKGKSLIISGKIFSEPEVDGDQLYLQVWYNPDGPSENYIAYGSSEDELAEGDYVIIEGVVEDEFVGENYFGTEITAPQIMAVSIKKSSYMEIEAPTLDEYKVDKTIKQNGISVTIDKIEFAESETRIYTKIANNSKDDANFYSFNTKAIVGNKQYKELDNYEANYPEIDSDLSVGVEAEGIITLKPIKNYQGKNMKVLIDVSSDNFDINMDTFTFNVKLK